MSVQERVISLYTEATPNPETMKFVLNRMLFPQNSADFPNAESAKGASALATVLFEGFDFVSGVFIMNNFVTVSKSTDKEWFEIIPELRIAIKGHIEAEKEIINLEVFKERLSSSPVNNSNAILEDDEEIVKKIKAMLTKYVQPAVEADGGSIVFRSFDQGIVKLGMQGSCSGCPSSTVTLKSGIEGLLKRMIPEVQSVEAEAL